MHRRLLFLSATAALAAPGFSQAAEVYTLPPLSVTGQRPALQSEPAALATEVDAQKLESINAPNVEDALKYEPNLVVRKRYIGDRNATLSFRDMHTTQTARALVLGDGLQLSNFLGSSWDTAPRWGVMQPEEIESVEVLYGPYSAAYGGNSLGGVVVLRGRLPERLEANAASSVFVQDFSAYGTDGSYPGYKLHASLGDRSGRWSYFLAADRLQSEGQPMEFGLTAATGGAPGGTAVTGARRYPAGGFLYNASGRSELNQNLLKLKLGYDLTPELQARLTLAYLDRGEDSLHPQTYLRDAAGNPVYNGTVDIAGQSYTVASQRLRRSEAQDLIYGAELEGALGGGWEIESALSFYKVLEQTDRQSGTDFALARAGGPGSLTEDQGTGWQVADLKLGHRHDGGWLGRRLLAGYHFERYTLDRASFDTAGWRGDAVTRLSGDSEGNSRIHALFLENEWRLSEPWTLTLGGRQEWWQAYDGALAQDFGGDRVRGEFPERSESRFSPKASLAFAPNRDWLASLSLGVAWRFPTVGELYQGSIDNLGNFSVSFDPDLRSEHGFAKNLMLKRYLDAGELTLNLWENDVEDAIYQQRSVISGIRSYQNIDRVRSRGVELVTAFYDVLPGLDLDFNLSYTRARILDNAAVPASKGKQFPRVPEWRASLFVNYRAGERLKLGAGARYASDPYDTLENSDGHLSGFGFTDRLLVFDMRASYALGDRATVAAGIDNLTDERYYVYHPYPGRTLFAELKWAY